jgi:hypothetical protein
MITANLAPAAIARRFTTDRRATPLLTDPERPVILKG